MVLPILDRYATEPLRIRNEFNDGFGAGGTTDSIEIGLGFARGEDPGPEFVVRHPAVWRAIARRGLGALGSSYADGWWTTSDLEGVVRFFVALVEEMPSAPNVDPITRRLRAAAPAPPGLGAGDPALLGHILDKTMFDGTARYEPGTNDLYQATLARFGNVCDSLDIQPDDRILELGTGWGAFALYAARVRRCEVVSVASSETEATFARQRLANAGLTDQVEIQVGGIESITEQFTKIVSLNSSVWSSGPRMLAEAVDSLMEPGGHGLVITHVAGPEGVATGPNRPTLADLSKSFGRHRIRKLTELADDDIRSTSHRISNLAASQETLDRAGYTEPVIRARRFDLVRDKVLAERLAIRAIELQIR